jgi:hypothetical protein
MPRMLRWAAVACSRHSVFAARHATRDPERATEATARAAPNAGFVARDITRSLSTRSERVSGAARRSARTRFATALSAALSTEVARSAVLDSALTSGQDAPMADQSNSLVDAWIWSTNLRPFAEVVGRWAGYGFDDIDWDALDCGLRATNRDDDTWFTYPLGSRIELTVARNVGDDPVSVRVRSLDEASDELRVRVTGATEIFSTYRVE